MSNRGAYARGGGGQKGSWNGSRGGYGRGGWRSGGQNQQQGGGRPPFELREGQIGLFFTIDGDPSRGVKEAHRIIDQFVVTPSCNKSNSEKGEDAKKSEGIDTVKDDEKKEHKNEESSAAPKELDISDLLSGQCSVTVGLGPDAGGRWPRDKWRQNEPEVKMLETGVKNTLFFTSPTFDAFNVYQFADSIVNTCGVETRCRFLARVIPVERIIRAFEETFAADLERYVVGKVQAFIENAKKENGGKEIGAGEETKSTEPLTYAVDFSHRNSEMIKRQTAYDLVAGIFTRECPQSSVSIENPQILIIIQVIRSVVLLSCVPGKRYLQDTRRFAIRPPAPPNEDEAKLQDADKIDNEEAGKKWTVLD